MKIYPILIFLLFVLKVNGQSLEKYFVKFEIAGSISLYDTKAQTWTHSNSSEAKRGTLPASTFKIINTLIALEEKVVKGKSDIFKWDGEPKYFKETIIPNWNEDNNLEMAFKNSTVWYYE